jgi:hypothetical protein
VIRSDWRSHEWVYWRLNEPDNQGAALELDASPFWSISGKEIRTRAGSTDDFYVPVPADLGREGAPMTGILLRWQRPSHGLISWPGKIEEGDRTNHSPRWIVTELIEATGTGKPLTDIEDGRFQYDSNAAIADTPASVESAVLSSP